MTFSIDPEFKSLIRELGETERYLLEKSLKEHGCLDPIIIWKEEKLIIDGHNRFEICSENNIKYDVKELSFSDRGSVKVWILKNQLGKRNINVYERTCLALLLKEEVEKQFSVGKPKLDIKKDEIYDSLKEILDTSSEESVDSINTVKDNKPVIINKSKKEEVRKSWDSAIGDIAKVSKNTVRRVEFINKNGNEDEKKKLKEDRASINNIFSEVKKRVEEVNKITVKERVKVVKKNLDRKEGEIPLVYEGDCSILLKNITTFNLLISNISGISNYDWLDLCMEKMDKKGKMFIAFDFVQFIPLVSKIESLGLIINNFLCWYNKDFSNNTDSKRYLTDVKLIAYVSAENTSDLHIKKRSNRSSVISCNSPDNIMETKYSGEQDSMALSEKFIKECTSVGDIVIDPFAGTGTFVISANNLGRKGYGSENDPKFIRICKIRGCEVI